MTGFLIVSGKSAVVSSLSLEKVQDFCAATDMSCHSVTISPVERPHRSIIGLQLTHGGIDDMIKAYCDRYVFLQGTVFGTVGSDNMDSLSNDQARRFLATRAGRHSSFSPRFLDGDCSLALVCARTGDIQVFNDSEGFRRIFYYQDRDVFVVSTRLPLILRLLDREWTLDRRGARVFLADREPRWPLSAVQDIKTLPPVHELVLRNGELRIASYWQPVETRTAQDRQEVARQLHRALSLAVRRKAKGRRTVVASSGGYDSTCLSKLSSSLDCDIGAMSAGYLVENLDTDSNTYNETEYASRIAKELGIPFQSHLFGLNDVREMMGVLPRIVDQPGHDPTTFLLFSKVVRENGYQAVITGMGGDACFSPKNHLTHRARLLPCLHLGSKIPLGRTAIGLLTRAAKARGPFSACRAYLEGVPPQSVFELLERAKRGGYILRVVKDLLGEGIINDLNEVTALRAKAMDNVIENAGSPHEWHFLFALWANPDEYHSDFSLTHSGLVSIMPFCEPLATNILFSHAAQDSLCTRQFEVGIFGGIPEDLLVPCKSGFVLPYERWCPELLLDDLEEIIDDDNFLGLELNVTKLSEYVNALKHPDWHTTGLMAHSTATFLWRLVMLKRYAKANNLRVPFIS